MALIGCARVSTGEQTLDPQFRELRAGSVTIHEEHRPPAPTPCARPWHGFRRRSGPATRWWWCASTGWLARRHICWR